jgi:hypothetical protein
VSGGSGGSGKLRVRKAGVLVGQRPAVNLIEGANVTLTMADDAANDRVNVTIAASGGGGGSGVDIEDEGAAQGTATTIDFVGSAVTAAIVGAVATVTVTHGNLAGGSLHDVATGAAAGFMSAADKTKLDGVAASAAALTGSAPADVGTTAVGVATAAARADHVHAHGNQAGGTLHANAVAGGAAGFLTGADKTKLDSIASGATNGITTQDEGAGGGSNQTTLNFVGAGVTASVVGAVTTVTIPGGSGIGGSTGGTDNQLLRSDGTGGATAQASGVTLDDNNAVYGHRALVNAQTGTTYTFQESDRGKHVLLTNAGAITATVPSSLLEGWQCSWEAGGAGQITFVAGSGATLNNRSSHTKSAGQHAVGGISVKTGTGANAVATLYGDTAA